MYGVYIDTAGSSGVVTNEYGLYLDGGGVGTNNWGLYEASTDPNYFAGSVGIGTASPAAALQVASGGLYVSNYGSGVSVPGGGTLGMYLRGSATTSPFGFSAAGSGNISASAPLFFYSWAGSSATKLGFASYDGSTTNQFVTFDYTTGNVGIGTTSPQATLDVNGFARLALNSSAPATCSSSNEGAIALTHLGQVCVCDTTPAWNVLNTGTACSW